MSLPESLSAAGGQALQAILNSPSDTLIATDFDGTLAPIVDDPEQAYADPEAVAALGRLGQRVGAVVVITGRPARTAVRLGRFREIAGLSSMIVLGQYGVERWNAVDDEYHTPAGAAPGSARWPRNCPKSWTHLGWPGPGSRTRAEPSRCIPACCPIRRRQFVKLEGPLRELAARHGLVLEPGKNVWEIRAPGMDKGRRVAFHRRRNRRAPGDLRRR